MSTRNVLSIWTVYDQPRDFPDHFVARRFEVESTGPQATDDVIVSRELEHVRQSLALRGLMVLPRSSNDEQHIIECWL